MKMIDFIRYGCGELINDNSLEVGKNRIDNRYAFQKLEFFTGLFKLCSDLNP